MKSRTLISTLAAATVALGMLASTAVSADAAVAADRKIWKCAQGQQRVWVEFPVGGGQTSAAAHAQKNRHSAVVAHYRWGVEMCLDDFGFDYGEKPEIMFGHILNPSADAVEGGRPAGWIDTKFLKGWK